MKKEHYPPKENALVLRIARLALPPFVRLWRGVEGVVIPEEELRRLSPLRDSRFLLCSNHPTLTDPYVLWELARRLGTTFNYMAARELFRGPLGWLLQRVGAYSVVRGRPDREAMRTTRRLLAVEDRRVAVFPEGVTYEQNDLLLPFQAGVVQIGFGALEDQEKRGKEPRLPVVPVAIKYLCQGDSRPVIAASLVRLERALALQPAPKESLYPRLRAVGEHVLGRMEREFGLSPSPETPLAGRIAGAKEHVLGRVASELGVRLPAGASPAERLHFLDHALAGYVREFAGSAGEAERHLHRSRLEAAPRLERDLRRLHNFLAVSDGYVAAGMTAERFLDVLGHLEVELFGRRGRRPLSRAHLRVGEVLELGAFYPQYRESKRAALAAATSALEERVHAVLRPLSALGTPVMG